MPPGAVTSVYARQLLDDPAALEGAAEGDLVGVLEVAADRAARMRAA